MEAKDERAHDVFAAFDNDGSGAPWQIWQHGPGPTINT